MQQRVWFTHTHSIAQLISARTHTPMFVYIDLNKSKLITISSIDPRRERWLNGNRIAHRFSIEYIQWTSLPMLENAIVYMVHFVRCGCIQGRWIFQVTLEQWRETKNQQRRTHTWVDLEIIPIWNGELTPHRTSILLLHIVRSTEYVPYEKLLVCASHLDKTTGFAYTHTITNYDAMTLPLFYELLLAKCCKQIGYVQ